MARSLRIEYPGAVYHVLNRGNYRTRIFSQEKAKQSFEDCLFNACIRYNWRLYAYCLPSNHYHIAIETPEVNLSMGMQWLQSDGKAKRQVQSSKLCRGWALGSKQFKEELVDQFLPVGQVGHLEGRDLAEANEIRWNRILAKCLAVMEKDSRDIRTAKKSVHWKALIALFMKDNTSVSNVWLTNHLNMGIPQGVSRSTRILANSKGRRHVKYLEMIRITA